MSRHTALCLSLLALLAGVQGMMQAQSLPTLDAHHLLLTSDAAQAAASPYAFADAQAAFAALPSDGTQADPVVLYIAPGVYWTDDPDDPTVRTAKMNRGGGDGTPYAIQVRCPYLHMIGLADDPQDVVLASNRGQTQGALGNYTMLQVEGNGIEVEGITFGNYCNIDLVYPRDTTLNRPRRKTAIVQAQLAHCKNTDHLTARRCRFVSRLNLCPFTGAKAAYYEDCHFECTDDALPWTATFRRCHFDFYGTMPFYSTIASGVRLDSCQVETHLGGYPLRWVKDGGMAILRHSSVDGQFFAHDTLPKPLWRLPHQPGHPVAQQLNDQWLDVSGGALKFGRVQDLRLHTSFNNVDVTNRRSTEPGQWTFDVCKPADIAHFNWVPNDTAQAWYYGTGEDNAEGVGLVQASRGARLFYTPRRKQTGAMDLMLRVAPAKLMGQGFGSATGQYMDIYLKFDLATLTGYALRIERTPNYGEAVEMCLVEYRQGQVTRLTPTVATSAYRTTCTLRVSFRKGVLEASAVSNAPAREPAGGVVPEAVLQARVPDNGLGGVGIQHTGTLGASATLIQFLDVTWKN